MRIISARWTDAEQRIFEKMYEKYGKAFASISAALNHKTRADVVEYYYTWKKVRFEALNDQIVEYVHREVCSFTHAW